MILLNDAILLIAGRDLLILGLNLIWHESQELAFYPVPGGGGGAGSSPAILFPLKIAL